MDRQEFEGDGFVGFRCLDKNLRRGNSLRGRLKSYFECQKAHSELIVGCANKFLSTCYFLW